jgi:hypothetical protein
VLILIWWHGCDDLPGFTAIYHRVKG